MPRYFATFALLAVVFAPGCFKDFAPSGPIPDSEETLGAPVAASGAVYTGEARVPFPVVPFRLWGLDFSEEFLWEFAEDPTYGMVEIARIARRDGTHTFFALVSEKGGRQHVGLGDAADTPLAAAFPAPSYDARLRVVRLESETHASYDVAFVLPDGRLVQAHAQGKNSHPAPSQRNGHAMNHSRDSVLAVLDLREMGLSQTTVYVDDRWVPTRVLLPFVPYSMRLVQAAGGVAAGAMRFEADGEGARATIGDGGPKHPFEVVRKDGEIHLVGHDPLVDHVYRFRPLGDDLSGPLELVGVSVEHGGVEVFAARFNPPVPDLRWEHADVLRSRVVAGAYGQDGYMTGEVRVTPEDGTSVVDVLPERRPWACERPVRTRIRVLDDAVLLDAVVDPALAAGGLGPEGCAALDR